MTLELKYTIFVLGISVTSVAVGVGLLFSAFRNKGRAKEFKLAAGNGLIALFAAIGSAFLADILRPIDGEAVRFHATDVASGRSLSSDWQCLDQWYLPHEIYHYSLTRAHGTPVWQVGRPIFSRVARTRIIGHGVWLSTVDGSRNIYEIEVGCRGKRGIFTFTLANDQADTMPTIEVYPELPHDNLQPQIVGYAIDRAWDERELLAPVMISRMPLHGSTSIGPIMDKAMNGRLSSVWREHYARDLFKDRECTLCPLVLP